MLLVQAPSRILAQGGLNANPLDTFPPSVAELVEISKKNAGLANALQSFQSGNGEKLKADLLEAKKLSPEFPKTDVMLARMFMANRQWAEALTVLEGHVALNPNDAEAYKSFGEVAMVSGRWTDSWLQFEKAVALTDGMSFPAPRKANFQAELTKLRAESAEKRQDIAVSTKLFEELAKLQPKDGYAYWSLGRLKIAGGDEEGGMALLKKGRAITATLPQPELAVALELVGKNKPKAERWFKDGILDKATATEANWVQYIRFLIDEDRVDAAKPLLEKAPAEYQKSRDVRLLKAVVHRYSNEDSDAEKILIDLLAANPADVDASDQLALVLCESKDPGKQSRAQQISEANLGQAPNVEKIAATAAWVRFKNSDLAQAGNILDQIVKGGRISPQTAYYVAMLLRARGQIAQANQFLKIAVEAPGSFPQKKAAKAMLPPSPVVPVPAVVTPPGKSK